MLCEVFFRDVAGELEEGSQPKISETSSLAIPDDVFEQINTFPY